MFDNSMYGHGGGNAGVWPCSAIFPALVRIDPEFLVYQGCLGWVWYESLTSYLRLMQANRFLLTALAALLVGTCAQTFVFIEGQGQRWSAPAAGAIRVRAWVNTTIIQLVG